MEAPDQEDTMTLVVNTKSRSDIPNRRISTMKFRTLIFGLISAAASQTVGYAQTTSAPEIDACRASGLIALKERAPAVKDVNLDLDSVRVVKMNSKIENVEIKAIVLGEAYIEKQKSGKPQNFICILGDKGKVLLTIFSDQ
jgi:hypothetical protein